MMIAAPAPLDDTADWTDLLACPKLRWGILGCGRVSHDFCRAVSTLVKSAELVACATSNDVDRAKVFAATFGIPSAYGSYENLVQDTTVDIIYVGNVHSFRRRDGEMCLNAGKHVLLEKPLACTIADAQYLINLAREKKLFLMEGMWTRFFPAFITARQLIADGAIGQIVNVVSDFHFNASDSEDYPTSFVYQRTLGGGASLLMAVYPLAAALAVFGSRRPKIRVIGQVDETTGVDLQTSILLEFPPDQHHDEEEGEVEGGTRSSCSSSSYKDPRSPLPAGAGMAVLSYGMMAESNEVTTIVGTMGRITIESPGHCPTVLLVEKKAMGDRGQSSSTERLEFPLPTPTTTADDNDGKNVTYHYPNSAGFCYEAAAVARCIEQGCCPQYTQDESLLCQEILAAVRTQLSMKAFDEE
jgi:dihydrodiol dehydrogenase / D-xylose 1-dehydrogenase (NADP)